MRRELLVACLGFTLVWSMSAPAAQEPPAPPRGPGPLQTSCIDCHSQLDDTALEPTQKTGQDIHFERGLSCHDCHGGNPELGFDGDPFAAHDEEAGFLGKPARTDIPGFCARCHSDATYMKRYNPQARVDQLSEYVTSMHGQRIAAGDDRVATCVDCHGVHGILDVGDPRAPVYPTHLAETCARCHTDEDLMREYGLKTGQYDDYMKSVHARALHERGDNFAPTCNDCHGSHGAVPPGVDLVSNVCGSCHGREATMFREVEARTDMNLEPCIQCVICHSNHAVLPPSENMLGVGPESTCTGCHAEGENGWTAAIEMGESLRQLAERLHEAETILDDAERAGVEISPDRFALQKAQDNLIEARVLVHSFDLERFATTAAEGIAAADEGVAAGERAFAELRTRRTGLGLSLIVIVAVILALVMTIRRLEA